MFFEHIYEVCLQKHWTNFEIENLHSSFLIRQSSCLLRHPVASFNEIFMLTEL